MAKITWTFKNEEGTNLNRYIATNVSTGEKITFDLLRGGNISVVGTPLNAENLNALITAINACYDLISSSEKDTTYTLSKNGNAIRLTSSDGTTNDVTLDKSNVGLGNVDNTSDLNKPISTATQQVLNKSLYNLGAFDTISGNVITRQTGYVDLGSLEWFIGGSEESWTGLIFATYFYQAKFINTYQTNAKVSSRYNVVGRNSIDNDLSLCIDWDGYGAQLQIKDNSFVKTTEGLAQFKASLQGIMLQYELVDNLHYTEEIIEGQPLITLDQQGSQWLRSEWEKGLNLVDFTTANPNYYKTGVINGDANVNNNGTMIVGVDASTDYGRGFKIQVKANTTYTLSFDKNITNILYVEAFQNNTSIQLNSFGTSGRVSFTFTTNDSSDFIVLGFSTTGSAVGTLTISDLMLNYGPHPYPYKPYNSKEHITNPQADFLKEESLKSANLFDETKATNGKALGEWTLFDSEDMSASDIIYVKPNTTYTFNYVRVLCFGDINGNYISGSRKFLDSTNFTFTTPSNCYCIKFDTTIERLDTIMLNEGSEALPYQEYNGAIVREKQLNELDNKKANKSDVYTKSETDNKIDSIIAGETSLTNYYTKTETDNKLANKVPITRTVNGKALSTNITLSASDVGARPSDWTPSKTDVGLGNVDNTSDSEKEVASAKVLKNNDVSSFTLSAGVIEGINFNDNSVYLIYNNTWCFIMRIGDKNKYFTVQSTVCYNEGSSRPLWFIYDNTNGFRLSLKTTKTVSSNEYVTFYETNGTFNYKLLATD